MPHRFDVRDCPDEEALARLFRFSDQFLARVAKIDEERVLARFRQCPTAFRCIFCEGKLAGYFILLPLNDSGLKRIRSGAITAGRQIQLRELAGAGEPTAGLYLSAVCASGARAQHAAIHGVVAALRDSYSRENVRYFFVRAETEAGAHMLERISGTPFRADGRIHAFDLSEYDLITA